MKYNHKEAFCLMWYACQCGHRERYWNSRDGVTPFGDACPSCGETTLQHVNWNSDQCVPNHKPYRGQRVWVSMTRERAIEITERQVKRYAESGHIVDKESIPAIADSIYHNGEAPDCIVWGTK
jgi:hypothetical protein